MGGRWRLVLSNNVENLLLISQVLVRYLSSTCVLLLGLLSITRKKYLLALKLASTTCKYLIPPTGVAGLTSYMVCVDTVN
jgi:hypothetical protein